MKFRVVGHKFEFKKWYFVWLQYGRWAISPFPGLWLATLLQSSLLIGRKLLTLQLWCECGRTSRMSDQSWQTPCHVTRCHVICGSSQAADFPVLWGWSWCWAWVPLFHPRLHYCQHPLFLCLSFPPFSPTSSLPSPFQVWTGRNQIKVSGGFLTSHSSKDTMRGISA